MLHVYRQIREIRNFSPLVITQKRVQEVRFPFEDVRLVPRSCWRWVGRVREQHLDGFPWQVGKRETAAIQSILTEENCLLLHVFFGNVAIHLLPLLRKLSIPLVVSIHGADVASEFSRGGQRKALEEVFSLSERVVCRSESLRQRIVDLGCPAEKTALGRTAVPETKFQVRTPPESEQWVFVQACRMVPKKGLETTLRAFAHFLQKYPNSHLHLAGDGPLLSELEKLVQRRGLTSSVTLHGFLSQDKLCDLLQQAHVFIHPSEDPGDGNVEGIPNSMLEAMMSGLPVLATRHGGIPEAVTNGKEGILVEEKDAEGLGQAMEKIAQTQGDLEKMSQAAREKVMEQFSQEKRTVQLAALYEEVLNPDIS